MKFKIGDIVKTPLRGDLCVIDNVREGSAHVVRLGGVTFGWGLVSSWEHTDRLTLVDRSGLDEETIAKAVRIILKN